jgi:hypothetical protein
LRKDLPLAAREESFRVPGSPRLLDPPNPAKGVAAEQLDAPSAFATAAVDAERAG